MMEGSEAVVKAWKAQITVYLVKVCLVSPLDVAYLFLQNCAWNPWINRDLSLLKSTLDKVSSENLCRDLSTSKYNASNAKKNNNIKAIVG